MPQDYNKTLNLPSTDFPMRASLPVREPEMLSTWEKGDFYNKLMEKNSDKPLYVLHDGPPYANGDIHMGHALNKILKDFVVRYKNIAGFKSPYVPGWDTHGLPIELQAMKSIGVKNIGSDLELRAHCREFALKYVNNQLQQFKRLGIIAEYDDPYLTLNPDFEAMQIRVFGEMAKKDYIYKGLKPVYWCPHCQTALAEAEIEYHDDKCFSIYVKFPLIDDKGYFSDVVKDIKDISFVIWTTTTWTLPGNVAICLGPNYEYSLVKAGIEYFVMATDLVESSMKAADISEYEIIKTMAGKDLEYMKARHPFLDRDSLIILGDHVTLESGTGCVHTAPGHGVDDFAICQLNYKELPIVVPVDNKGYLTKLAGRFEGLETEKANKIIADYLRDEGLLFAVHKITHQYPHCWRCKSPIIFRATEQWFCSIDGFKDKVLDEIKKVKWTPAWGENRMAEMVESRNDWCISRQRVWGVPIPIFYCDDCEKYVVNDETISSVADLFEKEGADAWYKYDAKEILPDSFACPHCGGTHFTKETDIMDVWFDSGTSHASVLKRDHLHWPADLYLEGGDQYRGWFQSSMLTAVASQGKSPYKAVCTHGMVVDVDGKKMSKSLGNGIEPADVVKQYGADILRLWVASSDYHSDLRLSKDSWSQMSEVYRKIRNTARFILSNLGDFDPNTDMVDESEFTSLDRWALDKLDFVIDRSRTAYDEMEFHVVFHTIRNFCVVDMSNFYLDILKDRLYVENTSTASRRAAQTTIYKILSSLTRLLSPLLAFTSDEIWKSMKHLTADDGENVLFNDYPVVNNIEFSDDERVKLDRLLEIRDDVKKALETARKEKRIGASLEAVVTLHCSNELKTFFESVENLKEMFIVSEVVLTTDGTGEFAGDTEGLSVTVVKSPHEKCERCWIYSDTIGEDSEHSTLCSRCVAIVKNI